MASAELNLTQIAEQGILRKIANQEHLSGLAEIAAFTGWSIGSVREKIKKQGMPAAKSLGRGGKYYTTKTAVRSWIREQHLRLIKHHNWDEKT